MRGRSALLRCWHSLLLMSALLLAGCAGLPGGQPPAVASAKGQEVVMYAIGLINTGYRFGGKNPEAGFDCSGMVSYIYAQAAAVKLTGSAADMARKGKVVDNAQLRPGDLLFFNTLGRPRSHVAIYIGEGRFIHAPSTNGKVRIDRLDNRYYAARFEEARSYFD